MQYFSGHAGFFFVIFILYFYFIWQPRYHFQYCVYRKERQVNLFLVDLAEVEDLV